ncbi:uncharacterized protein QC761_105767 [Podospora bellae-mahoneyi]|uniref:Uncharacterized protein n=1 Tax=Podospora bellae-mahoneyi TaxID=2093777 RepID=A0ABR0FVE4_9PEZI|nr:hypothetical protein QC761_105767 [Podospora bellae-mahoneyi]
MTARSRPAVPLEPLTQTHPILRHPTLDVKSRQSSNVPQHTAERTATAGSQAPPTEKETEMMIKHIIKHPNVDPDLDHIFGSVISPLLRPPPHLGLTGTTCYQPPYQFVLSGGGRARNRTGYQSFTSAIGQMDYGGSSS